MIAVYDMLKPTIGNAEDAFIKTWLALLADKEVKRKPGINNWNSHHIKIIDMVAYATGNIQLQAYSKST